MSEGPTETESVFDYLRRVTAERDDALSKLGEMTKFRDECERQFQAKVAEVGELQSRLDSTASALTVERAQKKEIGERLRTLAIGVGGARLCLAEGDDGEAYHILYNAARALSDDAHEPWKGVDALADGAIERRDGKTYVQFTAVEKPATSSTAHVHYFKPNPLVPGEHVCSCGQYYVV